MLDELDRLLDGIPWVLEHRQACETVWTGTASESWRVRGHGSGPLARSLSHGETPDQAVERAVALLQEMTV